MEEKYLNGQTSKYFFLPALTLNFISELKTPVLSKMEAGSDFGADDTMVDLENSKEDGGADAMVYGDLETDVVCMEVETDGVSYNGGAPDGMNVMVVGDIDVSEDKNADPKGSIKNYFLKNYTRRKTDVTYKICSIDCSV